MSRLTWGSLGTRFFEAGVDRGVLYVDAQPGVPWTGLLSVEEAPTGGEANPLYLDGVKYLNLPSLEEFNATLRAYTYPNEFSECDGTARVRSGLLFHQQRRKSFGLSYRTMVGNDVDGASHAYKIHIIYDALAAPSQKSYSSLSDTTDPSDFSWGITTRPPRVSGYKPTSHVVIDSRDTNPITLRLLENILYGSDSTAARLPTIAELIETFDALVDLTVTDNHDDTFTITGPDEAIIPHGSDQYFIDWPTVVLVDTDRYRISE